MNEPIKELAKQTITRFDQDMDGSMQPEEFGQWVLADDLQKFAELIVQECLDKVSGLIVPETFEQDIGPYEKWNQALGHAALEIEQHFGVEE